MTGAKWPHIVIYEPACSGHRLHHVRWIAAALMRDGRSRVTLLTGKESLDHPALKMVRNTCGDTLTIRLVPTPQNSWPRWARRSGQPVKRLTEEAAFFVSFRRAVSNLRKADEFDFVLVPCLDYFIHVLGMVREPLGDVPWGGTTFRPRFHMGPMGIQAPIQRYSSVEKLLFHRLLGSQSLRRIFSLDPFFVDYVRSQWPASAAKVEFVPDPADMAGEITRECARRALGIGADQVVVLAYGTLSGGKGVDALFRAMADPSVPETVIVLLAGSQLPGLGPLMTSPLVERLRRAGRLIELNEYVTNLQEEQTFKAADIVWLGYRGHYGSSGVQVQAGVVGLPVLATNQGLVGRLTMDQGLGEAVPIEDSATVATALARLAGDSGLRARYGANGKRFFAAHTVDHFGETVARAVLATDAPD